MNNGRSGDLGSGEILSMGALARACHDMLNVAATLQANVEFLATDRAPEEREAATLDAIASVKLLVERIRLLQDTARRTADRAA
jgi:hypothetical protein